MNMTVNKTRFQYPNSFFANINSKHRVTPQKSVSAYVRPDAPTVVNNAQETKPRHYGTRIAEITTDKVAPDIKAITYFPPYVYTKEHALERINARTLRIDKGVASTEPDLFEAKENGIPNHVDFSRASADMYFTSYNIDEFRNSVEYLASRYVVMDERIRNEYSGVELEENLNKLDQLINTHKEKLADNFAGSISDILEENGVHGEREQLRQSVVSEINHRIEAYKGHLQTNKDYADVEGDDRLKRDSAYMASELRKSMIGSEVNQTPQSGYSINDMEKLQTFVKELDSYTSFVYHGHCATDNFSEIRTGNDSEESLGLKLGILALKGDVFNKYANVSDGIKNIVSRSVRSFTDIAIQKEQEFMDKWSGLQREAYKDLLAKGEISNAVAERNFLDINQNFAAVDKKAVYDVINKMVNSYEKTGNLTNAVIDGVEFAKRVSNKKQTDNNYINTQRYETSDQYWDGFFTSKNTFYSKTPVSEFDRVFDSLNGFTGRITSDSSALLTRPQFAALV